MRTAVVVAVVVVRRANAVGVVVAAAVVVVGADGRNDRRIYTRRFRFLHFFDQRPDVVSD